MKMFKANDASTKRIRIEPDGTFVGSSARALNKHKHIVELN